MSHVDAIKKYYEDLGETLQKLDTKQINEAIDVVVDTYKKNGTVYICGNGGSAATASHFASDFNKGIGGMDKKIHFICLNDNIATLTAIANDIDYESVFSFQLINRLQKGDLLIAISGSGNSKNILSAVSYAKTSGNKVIGITGYNGGELYKLADYHMHVPVQDMQMTEDVHMTFVHMMMRIFYNTFAKGSK
jgi:D-sedoheptulose 7-phosphate isomerase